MVIAEEGLFMIRDLHNNVYNYSDISRILAANELHPPTFVHFDPAIYTTPDAQIDGLPER